MSWMDILRKAVPGVTFGKALTVSRTVSEHPRVKVATSIQHSIDLLDGKTVVVPTRNGPKTPERVYTDNNGDCEIKLKYAREIVKLSGNETNAIKCKKSELKKTLQTLKEIVEGGAFDGELEKIRSARAAALKGEDKAADKSTAVSNRTNAKAGSAKKAA